jgi:hypothetical protein
MTPIAAVSSVPPHIHPPIAHVPRAMRDTLKDLASCSIPALSGLISEVVVSGSAAVSVMIFSSNIADVTISVRLTPSAAARPFPLGSGKQRVGLSQPNLGLKQPDQGLRSNALVAPCRGPIYL